LHPWGLRRYGCLFRDHLGYRSLKEESADSGVVIMGKGDKRTKRGKLFKGTFGKRRPKSQKQSKRAKEAGAAQS
jgi:30S ribosomal protein S31